MFYYQGLYKTQHTANHIFSNLKNLFSLKFQNHIECEGTLAPFSFIQCGLSLNSWASLLSSHTPQQFLIQEYFLPNSPNIITTTLPYLYQSICNIKALVLRSICMNQILSFLKLHNLWLTQLPIALTSRFKFNLLTLLYSGVFIFGKKCTMPTAPIVLIKTQN